MRSLLDLQDLATEFVNTALGDVRRAESILAAQPEVSGAGLYPSLVLGDASHVRHALNESPEFVKQKGGPRGWEPLLYVCFSRYAHGGSSRAEDLIGTAQLLLARGADPNAFYVDRRWADSPLSCLYGATGVNNNPELARVLLAAGARPDDGESLYHSTEHPDLACLRALIEHGASPRSTNVLKHMLDCDHLEGVKLLLDAGADPNHVNQRGATALHWAVWRGRSREIIAALLDAGANIDAKRNDGPTAYALAIQSGQVETAQFLESRGANTDLSEFDRFVGACATADAADLDRILAESGRLKLPEEYYRLLPEFASSHCTSAVRGLLAAGVPIDAVGDYGGTALHWACWKGYADLVNSLIGAGASLTIQDPEFHATPPGWFTHGLENSLERDGDYPEVARLLLTAGAPIPTGDIRTGNAAVDAVLREHGLIE